MVAVSSVESAEESLNATERVSSSFLVHRVTLDTVGARVGTAVGEKLGAAVGTSDGTGKVGCRVVLLGDRWMGCTVGRPEG